METLDSARIRKVNIHDFLYRKFDHPVYIQLSSGDYHRRNAGGHFNRDEFHHHPDRYSSHFSDFTKVTDILLAGAYWNPKAPVLFNSDDMLAPDFRIRIIADITCDINGPFRAPSERAQFPTPFMTTILLRQALSTVQ